ncbi:hypothetical protein GCM10010342_75460 [Streptomyces anulatus]|nr:hypothetical protein GCM10010342_75460 [Streptomyces anulatus]
MPEDIQEQLRKAAEEQERQRRPRGGDRPRCRARRRSLTPDQNGSPITHRAPQTLPSAGRSLSGGSSCSPPARTAG